MNHPSPGKPHDTLVSRTSYCPVKSDKYERKFGQMDTNHNASCIFEPLERPLLLNIVEIL
jgi:hypothetical protein